MLNLTSAQTALLDALAVAGYTVTETGSGNRAMACVGHPSLSPRLYVAFLSLCAPVLARSGSTDSYPAQTFLQLAGMQHTCELTEADDTLPVAKVVALAASTLAALQALC